MAGLSEVRPRTVVNLKDELELTVELVCSEAEDCSRFELRQS